VDGGHRKRGNPPLTLSGAVASLLLKLSGVAAAGVGKRGAPARGTGDCPSISKERSTIMKKCPFARGAREEGQSCRGRPMAGGKMGPCPQGLDAGISVRVPAGIDRS